MYYCDFFKSPTGGTPNKINVTNDSEATSAIFDKLKASAQEYINEVLLNNLIILEWRRCPYIVQR